MLDMFGYIEICRTRYIPFKRGELFLLYYNRFLRSIVLQWKFKMHLHRHQRLFRDQWDSGNRVSPSPSVEYEE